VDTFLMVATWKGTNEFWFTGTRMQSAFMSTYSRPGLMSRGKFFSVGYA
jgi:hypothetical protein